MPLRLTESPRKISQFAYHEAHCFLANLFWGKKFQRQQLSVPADEITSPSAGLFQGHLEGSEDACHPKSAITAVFLQLLLPPSIHPPIHPSTNQSKNCQLCTNQRPIIPTTHRAPHTLPWNPEVLNVPVLFSRKLWEVMMVKSPISKTLF